MNFTYYFYCDCTYDCAVHQYGTQGILQCKKCFQIEAKKIQQVYHLACVACENKTVLEGEVSFDPRYQETCTACGLSGEIGFEAGDNILFVLGTDLHAGEACTNCQRNDWTELVDEPFTCPFCFKELKQKMSTFWADEKKDET